MSSEEIILILNKYFPIDICLIIDIYLFEYIEVIFNIGYSTGYSYDECFCEIPITMLEVKNYYIKMGRELPILNDISLDDDKNILIQDDGECYFSKTDNDFFIKCIYDLFTENDYRIQNTSYFFPIDFYLLIMTFSEDYDYNANISHYLSDKIREILSFSISDRLKIILINNAYKKCDYLKKIPTVFDKIRETRNLKKY
jgi:hypothetical protein